MRAHYHPKLSVVLLFYMQPFPKDQIKGNDVRKVLNEHTVVLKTQLFATLSLIEMFTIFHKLFSVI